MAVLLPLWVDKNLIEELKNDGVILSKESRFKNKFLSVTSEDKSEDELGGLVASLIKKYYEKIEVDTYIDWLEVEPNKAEARLELYRRIHLAGVDSPLLTAFIQKNTDTFIKLSKKYSNIVKLPVCFGLRISNYYCGFDIELPELTKENMIEILKDLVNQDKDISKINLKTATKQIHEYRRICDLFLMNRYLLTSNEKSKLSFRLEDYKKVFNIAYTHFMKRRFRHYYKLPNYFTFKRAGYVKLLSKLLTEYKCNTIDDLVNKFSAVSLDVTNMDYFIKTIVLEQNEEVRISKFDQIVYEDTDKNFESSKEIKKMLDNLFIAEAINDYINKGNNEQEEKNEKNDLTNRTSKKSRQEAMSSNFKIPFSIPEDPLQNINQSELNKTNNFYI